MDKTTELVCLNSFWFVYEIFFYCL